MILMKDGAARRRNGAMNLMTIMIFLNKRMFLEFLQHVFANRDRIILSKLPCAVARRRNHNDNERYQNRNFSFRFAVIKAEEERPLHNKCYFTSLM